MKFNLQKSTATVAIICGLFAQETWATLASHAVPDVYDTRSNTQLVVSEGPTDLLANDVLSPATDVVEVQTDATTTQGGTVTLAADGSFTYTPSTGFMGVDTFTYDLVPVGGGASISQVTVTVTVEGMLINYKFNETDATDVVAIDYSTPAFNSEVVPDGIIFDGSSAEITAAGEFIATPRLGATTNTVTYAAWIKPTVEHTIYQFTGLIMCRDNTASGLMIDDIDATTGKLSGHWNDVLYPVTNVVVTKGEWNFVVMTVGSGIANFYAAKASETDMLAPGVDINASYSTATTLGVVNIGMDNRPTRSFIGKMRDVRIFNHTLNAAAIEALFDAEKHALVEGVNDILYDTVTSVVSAESLKTINQTSIFGNIRGSSGKKLISQKDTIQWSNGINDPFVLKKCSQGKKYLIVKFTMPPGFSISNKDYILKLNNLGYPCIAITASKKGFNRILNEIVTSKEAKEVRMLFQIPQGKATGSLIFKHQTTLPVPKVKVMIN